MDLLSLYSDRVFKQLPDITDGTTAGMPLTQSNGELTFTGGASPAYSVYNYVANVLVGGIGGSPIENTANMQLVKTGDSVTAYVMNAGNISFTISEAGITQIAIVPQAGGTIPISMIPPTGNAGAVDYTKYTQCACPPVFTTATSNSNSFTPQSHFTTTSLVCNVNGGVPYGVTLVFTNRSAFTPVAQPFYFSFMGVSARIPVATWMVHSTE